MFKVIRETQDWTRLPYLYTLFCSCDLDLDPMTLIDEHDLKTLKTYPRNKKMNFLGQGFQKLEHLHQTDREM